MLFDWPHTATFSGLSYQQLRIFQEYVRPVRKRPLGWSFDGVRLLRAAAWLRTQAFTVDQIAIALHKLSLQGLGNIAAWSEVDLVVRR